MMSLLELLVAAKNISQFNTNKMSTNVNIDFRPKNIKIRPNFEAKLDLYLTKMIYFFTLNQSMIINKKNILKLAKI